MNFRLHKPKEIPTKTSSSSFSKLKIGKTFRKPERNYTSLIRIKLFDSIIDFSSETIEARRM